MKKLLVIFIISALISCAPIFSSDQLKGVDRDLSFDTVLKDSDKYIGRKILIGGEIIESELKPDKSIFICLHRPLDFQQRPKADKDSMGRFIIIANGFLDPAIYKSGRAITVIGSILGKEKRQLDKIEYTYPVISKEELYLWPLEWRENEPRYRIGIGFGTTL